MTSTDQIGLPITTGHRAKVAYVYIRQSSPGQVLHNTESTIRQYGLVERAGVLGWPVDRVHVIDEDLAKSGTTCDQRFGFQQLLAEIALARVGLVISLEAARLARNNSDWYRLLELCSVFGTLIADCERVYDPRAYHDRLLLGLAGMMSEVELHHLKMRLLEGERSKAARGELRLPLPAGLERLRTGEVILHPDEEIQARMRLVFAKFDELGSGRAVMVFLQRAGLHLPTRPRRGPEPHEIVWVPATTGGVLRILQNPAYAGAYVYGRKTIDPARRTPGHVSSGVVRQPIDKWAVCLQDHSPAYLSWDQYLANRERLRTNQSNYPKEKRGVPRKGRALLQGIALCGVCGARFSLRYSGRGGQYPVYECSVNQREAAGPRCQQMRALTLDAEIEGVILAALEPDKIALALSALEHLEREAEGLARQWQLRIERARYEATRAQRQYDTVEPENRLVARNLERHWEAKLRAVEEIEREYQAWQTRHRVAITEEDRREILALGEDLPTLWNAPTTTNADRKQIIRLVIKDVILDQKRERGTVWFRINWQTGASTEHAITRGVVAYRDHRDVEALERRVRELNVDERLDAEIATALNTDGYRTTRGGPFTSRSVWHMRHLWDIPAITGQNKGSNPLRWDDGTYSIQGVAAMVGVDIATVHAWLRGNRIEGRQVGKGLPWKILLTDEQIEDLRAHRRRKKRREEPETAIPVSDSRTSRRLRREAL